MNLFNKLVRWALIRVSEIWIPRGRRAVRHLRIHDFELLALANEDVGRLISLFREYEPDETNYLNLNLKPEDICFDIGGNVGFFSMLMAKRASGGMVHVFEPIALNAALIRTNAELNGFGNLVINNIAVGAQKDSVTFSISIDSAYSSMHPTGRIAEEKSIVVPVETIDDYLAIHSIPRIDIMKVDVEGAEARVIEGAAKILQDEACRPRIVLLELFDTNLVPFNTDVLEVVARMVSFGYSAKVLSGVGAKIVPFTPDMANKFYNIIFVPRNVLPK